MTTYHLLLALHLVLAVFTVGPLVHAATTAGRGVRRGDGAATTSASRVLRIYSYVSTLVVASGIVLMYRPVAYLPVSRTRHLGAFSQTWVWLSLVLWILAIGVVFGVIVPTLDRATERITKQDSVVALTARVAAAGGVVGLLFVAIVVLMAFRPGQ